MDSRIPEQHGARLIRLVRETIGHKLGLVAETDESGLDDEVLSQDLATFVTLKKQNRLRGCIGNLEPAGPLLASLADNARHAAFNDHRFAPLAPEEFADIVIDISILSRPEPLDYKDADDLLAKLRPGTDGVILRKGRARATFLPQVWDQLPDPRMFLEHLCRKAGLEPTAWRDSHPEIMIYQVQSFHEE